MYVTSARGTRIILKRNAPADTVMSQGCAAVSIYKPRELLLELLLRIIRSDGCYGLSISSTAQFRRCLTLTDAADHSAKVPNYGCLRLVHFTLHSQLTAHENATEKRAADRKQDGGNEEHWRERHDPEHLEEQIRAVSEESFEHLRHGAID